MAESNSSDSTIYDAGSRNFTAESTSNTIFTKTVTGIKELFDTDLYKSFPVLALIGFAAVAFSGHLTALAIAGYIFFLLFLVFLQNLLFLIKEKPFELLRKFKKFFRLFFLKIRRLRLIEFFLLAIIVVYGFRIYFYFNAMGAATIKLIF